MTLARLAPIVLDAMLAASCSGSGKSSSSTTTAIADATGSGSGGTGARPPAPSSSTGRLAVGKRQDRTALASRQGVYIVVPIDKLQLQ
jgi:hypothetical protein